ncbi:MAG: LamG domain-containing protein, partial [Opitutales bacterium]
MRRIRTNNTLLPSFLYWASGLILLGVAAPQEAAASYSETVLAAEPIGYWQLNEQPGAEVAADSSGNGFSGSYEGDFVLGGQGPLWDGSESFEAVFDGSTTFVLIEDFFQDLTLEHSFTLEAWVKNRGQPGNSRILSSGLSDAGFGWGLNGAQGFLFTTFAILDYVDNDNPLAADNEWTHYVATFDENFDARFYVNGELAGMVEGGAPPNPGDETLTIGSSGPGRGNTEVWNGSVSDLAIYDRMLSEAEIRAHYEAAEIPLLELSGLEPEDESSSVDPAEGVLFDISSPDHSVTADGIEFILNGMDRSADLILSGDESAWGVQFDGLEANRFYSAEITVTNAVGFPRSTATQFNTFNEENFTWEANDWNFEGGQFHDNPNIHWEDDPNYFD